MSTRLLWSLAILTCVLHAPVLAGDVVVVTSGMNLQSAIVSTQNGDTVLVKSGVYSGLVLPDRELQVVADTGASVSLTGSIQINALSAGRRVVLSGLASQGSATGTATAERAGLYASGLAGRLRVQDCTFTGADDSPGVFVRNSADVCFTRTLSSGGTGVQLTQGNSSLVINAGMQLRHSITTIFDSVCSGGVGRDYAPWDAGNGGDGLNVYLGEAFAAGSLLAGAEGGQTQTTCAFSGDSGDGVETCAPASSAVVLLGNVYERGAAQSGPNCGFCASCGNGAAGKYKRHACGIAATDFGTHAVILDAAPVVREQTWTPLAVRSRAGERAFLLVSPETQRVYVPGAKGPNMLGPGRTRTIDLGVIPPGGELQRQLLAPQLAPQEESEVWHLQIFIVSPTNGPRLGSVRTLTIVDSAF